MKPHKHAELIKAWADGAEIEGFDGHKWNYLASPMWDEDGEYRIKPEPKPDVVRYTQAGSAFIFREDRYSADNLKLIYDGETGKLKSAEVLK